MTRSTLILLLGLLTLTGCRVEQPPRQEPMTLGGQGGRTLERRDLGIALVAPGGFDIQPSDAYVLSLRPAAGEGELSLDVPQLPPHIPGLIPLGAVRNGYVDDLRRQNKGLTIETDDSTTVAGANARRVRSTWEGGAETAWLTVHGGRVYIFRATHKGARDASLDEALTTMVQSVSWK